MEKPIQFNRRKNESGKMALRAVCLLGLLALASSSLQGSLHAPTDWQNEMAEELAWLHQEFHRLGGAAAQDIFLSKKYGMKNMRERCWGVVVKFEGVLGVSANDARKQAHEILDTVHRWKVDMANSPPLRRMLLPETSPRVKQQLEALENIQF